MRIKSKFHDYYDKCQALGQDQGLVFARVAQEVQIEDGALPPPQYQWLLDALGSRLPATLEVQETSHGLPRVICTPIITLFAGKIVASMRVVKSVMALESPVEDQVVYTQSRLMEALAALGCTVRPPSKYLWLARRTAQRPSIETFFESTGSTELLAQALEHRLPLASLTRERQGYRRTRLLCINPCLKEQEFFRYLDAWQAFQELSMFMGNLAAPERAMPQGSDKDRAAKHGMDEWSFRTMPQSR